MAEVDFGDAQLFEQLDDFTPAPTHVRFPDCEITSEPEDDDGETGLLRRRLEECGECIEKLTKDNKALRRKLKILTRPSGITVEDVNVDGPIVQIIYSNGVISKQYRQEIEDCIYGVITRHQKDGNHKRSASAHPKPQPSSFATDEDPVKMSSTSGKTTTEAFKVVGSVLYFNNFTVDKLGQPLVNENPQHTDGWGVPIYPQIFTQVIGTEGMDIDVKDKRSKSMCFNCGSSAHQMRDCPKPKDMAAINERRKEFSQNHAGLGNQRYHADEVEERFAKYKPGILSEELLTALGLETNTLPPLIYRMRRLGYPPGWLKEAEMETSGLTLYDGNVSNDNSMTSPQNISYDISKLVDFPGFNVPAPHKVKDEFMRYSSIPIQNHHLKHNYAAYLSTHFATSYSPSSKRPHESGSSPPHHTKRHKSSRDSDSDMDIDSDPGTPDQTCRQGHFQAPLPIGSPSFSSPPPLPKGPPPATPTPPPLPKSTPPRTPTNGTSSMKALGWVVVDEAMEGSEEELTLEELEEQQRLIWAALQNAEITNDNTTASTEGTKMGQSASVSTAARDDSETEGCRDENQNLPGDVCPHNGGSPSSAEPQHKNDSSPDDVLSVKSKEGSTQHPNVSKCEEDSPQPPSPKEDQLQSPGPVQSQDESPQSPAVLETQEESLQCATQDDSPQIPNPDSLNVNAATPKVSAVPHRSHFAQGIVPFEETPEYTEVAEGTGTYLRIRDLLKSSPRKVTKKNN
ncbi:zinc finger CCHC domain-containing protein 8 [Stigmatopora nigra]